MKTYKDNLPEITLKKTKTDFKRVQISCSKDSADYIRQFYSDDLDIYESFFLLLLNRSNNTIGFVKISQGGISGTVTDVRLIAKYVISSLATACIVCHNHPSGNTKPSDQDKLMTIKIKDALKLFDCNLLDHIILTSDSYYSFCDEGNL
jgi:DNA repair protein RadC